MALRVAARGVIPPFIVMEVMRAANARMAKGEAVFHLEVGQPGTAAPRGVLEAARRALDEDRLGYTEALGIAALRTRIADHYSAFYGVTVDAERIVVTTGSSGAFLLAFLSAFDVGDRVVVADPSYPAYRNILIALGVTPIALATGPETRFQPTVELLEQIEGPVHGLMIASPSNPSGTMLSGAELKKLATYCQAHNIRLISDEIYHGVTYGEKACTALSFTKDAVIINSFSKYFSMTGWRLGWMVVPEDLARSVECLAQNLFISPPSLSQIAAVAAFDSYPELDGNVALYARNREILLDQLPKAGLTRLAPADGAFYIYADIAHLTNDSETWCKRMLAETGIAATPGVDFDKARGHDFVRFSFSGPTEDIRQAARRLRAWLA